MAGTNTAVIFDTNSYRNFVIGKSTNTVLTEVEALREKEGKKNIIAFGSQVVGMEMLANLAEGEAGFNYKDCLNGVIAMANHCFDVSGNAPRIIPHPYLHITKSFFGAIPAEIEERSKNLGGVIADFKVDYIKAKEHHKTTQTFEKIKAYIEKEESDFSNYIIDLIDGARQEILIKHPRIDKRQLRIKLLDYIVNGPFEPFVAMAIIYAVAQTLQITLPQQEGIKRAFSLNVELPLSVKFYTWICNKIVYDNIDMQSKGSKEKRWNWRWDYEVSFLISDHTIDHREVILVTADTDMIEMLQDFGYTNRVMTLPEYLSFLDS